MIALDLDALVRVELAFARLDGPEQRFVARLAEALIGRSLEGTDKALRARAVHAALGLRGGPELEMIARVLSGVASSEAPEGGGR